MTKLQSYVFRFKSEAEIMSMADRIAGFKNKNSCQSLDQQLFSSFLSYKSPLGDLGGSK